MPDENTVSVTAGSTTVLGHLTQFVGFAGDTFNAGGLSVPVAAVVSTSELMLAYGWPGSDVIDSAAWVLMPTAPDWSSTVALHKAIVEANAWRNGKFPFPFNAGGPIAKRDLFDGEPTGFTFLELTGDQDDPFRLYGKMSDESGDWSVGQTLRGDTALSTQQAIDAAALAQAWATQESGEVAPGEGYSAKYHAGRSEGAADDAVTAAGLSEGFAGDASTSAGQSAGFATNASTAAALAQAWATQESGEVEPGGGFSAKYHAGQAAGSAADSEGARNLAQQWATKTDGEVVAGQGRGAKYYAEQAAEALSGVVRFDTAQARTAAEQGRAQQNIGGGDVGRDLFISDTDDDAQDAIGATTVGKALLTAEDEPDARSAIGAATRLPPYGGVESLAWAHNSEGDVVYGGTYAGSALRPTGSISTLLVVAVGFSANPGQNAALSGTWRCLGGGARNRTTANVGAADFAQLYQRVS